MKTLTAGNNAPREFTVFIEIPQGSTIKYELDKDSGVIFVDRFAFSTMGYPLNYGFIPATSAEDGDSIDVLVLSTYPVQAGCAIVCKPIGLLEMEDEAGVDTKILAVPITKVDPFYQNINDISDVSDALKNKIRHFFEHYKDLEPGKWVKLKEWKGREEALRAVEKGLK
jgi:inorganic pyrophosphatase